MNPIQPNPAPNPDTLRRIMVENMLLTTQVLGGSLTSEQCRHLTKAVLAAITAAGCEITPLTVNPTPEPVPLRNVGDVAEAILVRTGLIRSTTLQQYAFYAQAYSLAWTGQPMFDATVYAGPHGPVIPELTRLQEGYLDACRGRGMGNSSKVTDNDLAIITAIDDALGGLTVQQVAARVCSEKPWMDAFDEAVETPREIAHEAMRDFYRNH